MKNIISSIKKSVNKDVVNESFLNFIKVHSTKNDKNSTSKKITNKFQSQLQINLAFDELSKHYNAILSKEVKQIIREIKAQENNDKEDFSNFLRINYKELMSMFIEKKLIKPAPFHFENPKSNSEYIIHIMRLISFYVQDKFVTPLLSFIENNYIVYLMDNSVFPLQVEKLIKEIDRHDLVFEILKDNGLKSDKFRTVYSERNNCFYYLSYNKFVDLFSYNEHLTKVVNEFEEYINLTTQNIDGAYEKINLLNQIRLKVKSSILLFSKLPKLHAAVKKSLPQYAKNDTNAIYNQSIIESFHNSKVVQFNPSLIDFQDLQHTIAKEAQVFIKTKLWMLEESMELKNDESKSSVTHATHDIFHDKVKTNLTVPQLAFLFKCLYEEGDILEEKNKTALRQSISSCFTSKRKEDISAESIRTSFKTSNEKILEFWIEKFTHMMQFTKNIRENNRY